MKSFLVIGLILSVSADSIRSPGVEVLLHLPPAFSDVEAFKSFLGLRPERYVRQKRETNDERIKREGEPESAVVDSAPIIVQSPEYPVALPYPQYVASNDELETDDPRKRRNTSANDHEDKRPYPDAGINQDGSTTAPFWKHKKSNPPFVTAGREGRQNFEQTQRPRESHSMKDGKSITSNEIPRMTDSYYASSNANERSAYNSRPSAPKSVYDTIDYTNRPIQPRNFDPRARLADPYDRNYYQAGGEFANRGVEYYHRSVDPNNGRIIYYASLPEPEAYRASRSYAYYDTYGRSFPTLNNFPPPPYPYYNNPYWNPYQYPDYSQNYRNAPSQQLRHDDPRNKTYVIFDAEEKRFGTSYNTNRPVDDRYRSYTPPLPYPSFSPLSYNPYPYSSPLSPSPYPNNYNAYKNQDRGSIVRQVELPLTSRSALKSP